jgi:hypothetical protein
MSEYINKAEKLSRLYYANLLRKLNEGKSLSDKEFKHLQSLTAAPLSPLPPEGEGPLSKEEAGIPEHLRIKRSYTLTEKALQLHYVQ